MRFLTFLIALACFILPALSCEPDQLHMGCMIVGNECKCGYGCKSDYIYKNRRACRNAIQNLERSPNYGAYGGGFERTIGVTQIAMSPVAVPQRTSNICSNVPCVRGYCLQTTNELGFSCKCEGTGFYGQRCEKACPTMPVRGMVFPHECVVI